MEHEGEKEERIKLRCATKIREAVLQCQLITLFMPLTKENMANLGNGMLTQNGKQYTKRPKKDKYMTTHRGKQSMLHRLARR